MNELSLKTLLNRALLTSPNIHDDGPVLGVTASSHLCERGFLFVATRGATESSRDGHDFIGTAAKKGAIAAIVDADYCSIEDFAIPLLRVDDSKLALCKLAEAFHNFPSKKLSIIGITGTNGKTSTTFMLHNILKVAGFSPRIMGTLGAGSPGMLTPLTHTTMDPEFISAYLAQSLAEGASHVIMEISSHALSLKRVEALTFHTVALTNITQDHLDFHKTLEHYRTAKARLFFELAHESTIKVLPSNHPFPPAIEDLPEVVLYSPRDAPLVNELPFYGDFHAHNAMLAKTIAEGFGIAEDIIVHGLKTCPAIPGRLEAIDHPHGFSVFVDFAHTPHALLELLLTLRRLPHKNLIVVFGCGGDRDKEKRPLMGSIASIHADIVIVTDDNPRTENPEAIRAHIIEGIAHGVTHEIADRRSAIEFALRKAQKNDLVVIAGKGHENYQIYGTTPITFSDQEEARKVLTTL